MFRWWLLGLWGLLGAAGMSRAGLYYSGESYANLPSQWRGFLLDQRALRNIAVVPKGGSDPSTARVQYLDDAAKLEHKTDKSADDLADLGALYIRLGKIDQALTLLRAAQRQHPNHFTIAANLGTAWQLQGDLQQALLALQQAVRLAPGKYQEAEEYHLKLVRLRLQRRDGLDELFGLRYLGESGDFEPGKLAGAQRKKLPRQAVALTQQLALWLPADGRLLWQLAELANAHGDVKNAAAMMDGCVVAFALPDKELRRRRQIVRAAADELAKNPADPNMHPEKHQTITFRSTRALMSKFRLSSLPPISASGVNLLPWEVLNETTLEGKFPPAFADYLKDLAGKQVTLTGFMQPLRDDTELTRFMFIEYPVGCWYCEMPEITGIVLAELPEAEAATYTRNLVRISGRLELNTSDPEDFLYHIRGARLAGID